ncbi:MAG: galactose-1-phosphate uridylyltransferase [Bifidobacteriaceae bacterium]|jgi:UDPglucose--hexose-1-phosphate uridylyltransferase|nr:galactose-1-phosphate uridylyltransferase [Bifidobacteriaceae bacterium]
MTIRITPTQLADGREFFYFDDSPDYAAGRLTRRLDDPRPLTQRDAPFTDPATGALGQPTAPEMRFDQLTGEWIPMASQRMNRTFMPGAGSCPLCPANPEADYHGGEIPDTDYDVVVFENRFPSFWRPAGTDLDSQWTLDPGGLFKVRNAAGRCEVICFSPNHAAELASVSEQRMRTIIEAWAVRTAELQQLDGIAQVYPFENRGAEVGVTLTHPHGQIYAYPFITPKTAAMMRQARQYQEQTGRKLLQDVLDAELAGPRVVAASQHWAAYVPAAARWPVEVHVAPLRDVPDLPSLTAAERDDLAGFYLRLLGGLDRYFAADAAPDAAAEVAEVGVDAPAAMPLPYMAGWHQAPVDPELRPLGRLHLQLFSIRRAPDKLKYLASSESGMGAWISDTTPERIADRLRAALAQVTPNSETGTSPS